MREPRNTRERIQDVAMSLFSEQGYEQTSLREIAERLDVTKAALYYHFKTKEDIAASFFDDYGQAVDDLCDWGAAQPMSLDARRELLRRYADVLMQHVPVMRFMHQNQPALRKLDREKIFKERMRRLHGLLVDPDAVLVKRLRAFDSIMTMHIAWFMHFGEESEPDELREATLRVSIELLETNAREPS